MSAESVKLTLERMTYGSDALAHTEDGKTVFVSGGVAGDVVSARMVKDERRFSRAVVTEVLEPSPNRVDSPCPYASVCGGCPWASLSYDEQLASKRSNVVDALVRIGHFDQERAEALVVPTESPSKPWGYRNKVELAFVRGRNKATVGMHAAQTADGAQNVVKINSCLLLEKKYQRLVKSVSGAMGYLCGSHGIELQRVGIRASQRTRDVEVALWGRPGTFPRAQAAKVLADATKATSIVRVLLKGPEKARKVSGVEVLRGKGHWRERIDSGIMALSAPSFFQVNTAGAERLVQLVLEGLDPKEEDEAMDLYSGAGTFTLPLARRCAWVSAVESYGPAVRDLRRNLDLAGVDNAEPIGGDAGREFPDGQADVIVVDPPRAGLAPDVVRQLCAQPARAIAYVSCDPATLARDLARFESDGTFSPVSVTPVDLFPQTYHVETVVLLARNARIAG